MGRILVVDDDYDIVKYCESMLRSRGHEVIATTEATRALEILQVHPFDLVIIDILMPTMSGFDFLKTIKKIENFKSPTLMLTAKSSKEDVMQALKLGASDYVIKPIDHELFLAKVESVLGKTKATFAKAQTNSLALLNFAALITDVSEMGVTIKTASFMDTDIKARLDSDLFKAIGIATPWLRTVNCTPLQNDPDYHYEVFFSFVGLDENSMRKIRKWVLNKSIATRKAA